MSGTSLTQRFAVWFVAVSLVPILAFGWTLLRTFETEMQNAAIQRVEAIADKKAEQIDDYLSEVVHQVRVEAQGIITRGAMREFARVFARNGSESTAYRRLDATYRSYFERYINEEGYYGFFLISPQGMVVYSQKRESDFASNLLTGSYRSSGLGEVTRQALSTLQGGISGFEHYAPSANAIAAFVAVPIVVQGRIEGVLAVQIDPVRVFRVLTNEVGLGASGETVVTRLEDERTALVMAPLKHEPDAALKRKIQLDTPPLAAAIRDSLQGLRGAGIAIDYRGTHVVAATRYLPRMGWGMTVQMDADEALAPVYHVRAFSLTILGLTLLSALLSAMVLGGRLVTLLRNLSRSAQRIAAGNFDQRMPVVRRDELGQLAVSFNAMAADLAAKDVQERQVQEALRRSEAELRDLNENLEHLVTERTSALRESEKRYQHLLNAMPGAVYDFHIDVAGHRSMSFISEGIVDLMGISSAEAMADVEVVLRRIPLDAMPAMEQSIRASQKSLSPWLHEFPIRTTTGEDKWLSGHAVPHREEDGSTCWTGVLVDITVHKQAEGALQAAQDEVRQMQKMEAIGRLTGGIAHDFNNLLAAIMSQSELVLMNLADRDPILHRDVEEINIMVRRGAALTRQLLAISRKQPLQAQVLDLTKLVADLAPMLQRVIGEHIEFVVRQDPTARHITADPGQLEQVLLNLAINARDAMPQGGRLTISTADATLDESSVQNHPGLLPGRYARLTVSDTGMGMDEETQRHLFEPFFTTKEKGKGTGLGLATVYGIVTQNGGYISCASESGQGTTFEICFPGTEERAAASPEPKAAPSVSATGTETILLVEDNDQVRAVTRKILRLSGYTVLEAATPSAALSLAESHPEPIHLLVTDVVMPQMSGVELAGRVKALRPDIKVLHMSGYTDDAVLRNGRLPGGDAFLAKPFTFSALAETIRAVLDGTQKA
mgnify:CR=1 FL=1